MIPLFKVYMPKDASARVNKVLYSGHIAEGVQVRAFEQELQNFLGTDNIIAVNSCTSALYLALSLFEGADVLTTAITCIATNSPIVQVGANPRWVDVDPIHGMISPETLLESAFPCFDVRALIYVCWGGDIGPLQEVSEICKQYKIPLIVDAAQAFGAIPLDIADVVCYSFQAIKHLTTGDGGALQFKDPALKERAQRLKWFGIDRNNFRTAVGEIDWKSDIPEVGFKFHMNDIAGAIGRSQLQDSTLSERLEKYQLNDMLLSNLLQHTELERSWNGPSASWVSTFHCEDPLNLLEYLRLYGIHASQMHMRNDIYSGFFSATPASTGDDNALPGTRSFSETHISLPCGWWLTKKDIETIVSVIEEFYDG